MVSFLSAQDRLDIVVLAIVCLKEVIQRIECLFVKGDITDSLVPIAPRVKFRDVFTTLVVHLTKV